MLILRHFNDDGTAQLEDSIEVFKKIGKNVQIWINEHICEALAIEVVIVRIRSGGITARVFFMEARCKAVSTIRIKDPCTCILHWQEPVSPKINGSHWQHYITNRSTNIKKMCTRRSRTTFKQVDHSTGLLPEWKPGLQGSKGWLVTSIRPVMVKNEQTRAREDLKKNHARPISSTRAQMLLANCTKNLCSFLLMPLSRQVYPAWPLQYASRNRKNSKRVEWMKEIVQTRLLPGDDGAQNQ